MRHRIRLPLLSILAVAVAAVIPAAASAACPCTIWPTATTPATPAYPDNGAINVGVKFRTDEAGFVKGVRFYKGGGNTGTHVGSLWNADGQLLAQAPFANETASGWQQVDFAGPVPIAANTTYVASYHTTTGFYAVNGGYFATAGVDSPPLHALRDGVALGNGVYFYGGTSVFPTASFNSTNYWVDVLFDQTATDTTPPQVSARTPEPGATGVAVTSPVTATFNEPVQASTISMGLTGPSGAVAGTTSYNSTSRTATFTPTASLVHSTTYTATVSGARDAANNTIAPVSWQFTTAAPPPTTPPPSGGPILLVTSSNPFTSYYSEILRTEGLNEFDTIDVSQVAAGTLSGKDVVVLAEVTLSPAQVTALTDWVNAGGNLVAMRPDAKLAPLLGLTRGTGTRADGYLGVNTAVEAAAGITAATMQYHGTADRYTLNGATSVANLYTSATAATNEPAVSLRTVGTNGGQAAAFTFDLARSIVHTRQGNPAWAGQSRDGLFPIRSHELFRGVSVADWVNLAKVSIPQADEQQRLLANLIERMNRDRKPLPRFWYFPRSVKAVVIATGDDHGGGGTKGRFDQWLANSPAGCSVANWTCPRFSSYVFPQESPLTNAQVNAYNNQGFELGIHPDPNCEDYTDASVAQMFSTMLSQFRQKFTALPSPVSNRNHCVVWSNWLGTPKAELANGIRLDTTYYYFPSAWVRNRPGFMTGSGMPMRYADTNGATTNVYQAATQMTDESDQSYPFTVNTLLDNALGSQGYYGAFTANLHTDEDTIPESDAVLASAQSRNVPIVSSRQMLTWLDGRNASTFTNVSYSSATLSFTITVGTGANGLTAMVPTASANGLLASIMRDGSPVAYTTQTIKGLEYALFTAAAGTYAARYGAPPPAGPTVTALSAAGGEEDAPEVTWETDIPATTEIVFGEEAEPVRSKVKAEKAKLHRVKLEEFEPGMTYRFRVRSRDDFGRETVHPAPSDPPASYTVPPRRTLPPDMAGVRAVALPDTTASVIWAARQRAEGRVEFGAATDALTEERLGSGAVTEHEIGLGELLPGHRYYYRVTSQTPWGTAETSPTLALDMPDYGVADSRLAQFQMGQPSGVDLTSQGDGELRNGGSGNGSFVSRILDAQQMVEWRRAMWDADAPSDNMVRVQVRTGSMSEPDASWSPWIAAGNGEQLPAGVQPSRYLQYRIEMRGGGAAAPVVRSVGFTSSGTAPPHPKEVRP